MRVDRKQRITGGKVVLSTCAGVLSTGKPERDAGEPVLSSRKLLASRVSGMLPP